MISLRQLRMVQTLFSLYSRHIPCDSTGDGRGERLAWASQNVGREVKSFSELSADEAARLIGQLKETLGQESTIARRRPSRRLAHSYGSSGRKNEGEQFIVELVDSDTKELLDGLLARLGWNAEQFHAFLHSSRSPVKTGAVRTLVEANRAIWALKGMLRRGKRSQHLSAMGGNQYGGLQ